MNAIQMCCIMVPWHRLFGMILSDYFTGTPYRVLVEEDLSLKKQLLDVAIVEMAGEGVLPAELPDGLDDLGPYNLLSFKSHQDKLDAWTLDELVGHYVNYRKQRSPSTDRLLPEDDFRVLAVSARYPKELAAKFGLKKMGEGVYTVSWGSRIIKVLVTSRMPRAVRNALWLLFSFRRRDLKFGSRNYVRKEPKISGMLDALIHRYVEEGIIMGYTAEDFHREYIASLSPEERLRGLPPEERLHGLSPEERLRGLPPEVIEDYLKKINGNEQE